MTKAAQAKVVARMKETIGHIRDAEKNADAFYPAETIRHNMSEFFCGLAYALEAATGTEYHWSNGTDGNTWALVVCERGSKEDRYEYI